MKHQIFHVVNPSFNENDEDLPKELVGTVEASSLEEAFMLSQNLESSWKKGCRSTSIGDIIQDDNGFYLVTNSGFKNLDTEDKFNYIEKLEEL